MNDGADILRRQTRSREGQLHPLVDVPHRIARGGENLAGEAGAVELDRHVCERAADVDGEPGPCHASASTRTAAILAPSARNHIGVATEIRSIRQRSRSNTTWRTCRNSVFLSVFAYLGPAADRPAFPVYDTIGVPGTKRVPYVSDYPCNWLQIEAFVSQGRVTRHAKEHLATSDKGVALFRRRLRGDIRALAPGTPPYRASDRVEASIPTYAGDNVLRIPPVDGADDAALILEVSRAVARIVVSGNHRRGEARDSFVRGAPVELEASGAPCPRT